MTKIRSYLDKATLRIRYCTFVYPYLIYCVKVWGNVCDIDLDPIIKIQKKYVCVITSLYYLEPTEPILNTFLNHLCYTDDLCLISLSFAGMQKLLNLCSKYAVDHSLTYNARNSYSISFIHSTVKIKRPKLFLDTLVIPLVSKCKCLSIIVCQKNVTVTLKDG